MISGIIIRQIRQYSKGASINSIVYIGVDNNFYQEIQLYFKKLYPSLIVSFNQSFDPDEISTIHQEVLKISPSLVFLDFSFKTTNMLSLANILCRDEGLSTMSIIGLFDYEIDKKTMFNSFSLGVTINHIKSIEVQDVVHHAVVKAFPDKARDLGFLTVNVGVPITMRCALPIGYINEQYLHFESNINFHIDSLIRLEIPKLAELGLTKMYQVLRSSDTNIYTRNNYWFDVGYQFSDNSEIDEIREKKQIAQKEMLDKVVPVLEEELKIKTLEEEKLCNNRKHDLHAWVENHKGEGIAKTSRIVIVDKRVDLISKAITTFELKPYSIRYYTHIEESISKILKTLPGIIFYSIDYPENVKKYLYDEEELETKKLNDQMNKLDELWNQRKSDQKRQVDYLIEEDAELTDPFEFLIGLIDKIKLVENYNPFIVICNSKERSDLLKSKINYNRYIVNKNELSIEDIERFAQKYIENEGALKTHNPANRFHNKENRVYVDKYDSERFALFDLKAQLLSISESELFFATDLEISENTCLRIHTPIDMFITTRPLPRKDFSFDRPARKKVYYGLIWGLDEKGKSSLRRYINKLLADK